MSGEFVTCPACLACVPPMSIHACTSPQVFVVDDAAQEQFTTVSPTAYTEPVGRKAQQLLEAIEAYVQATAWYVVACRLDEDSSGEETVMRKARDALKRELDGLRY